MEREEGGVRVCAGDGGDGWAYVVLFIRPVEAMSVFRFLASLIQLSEEDKRNAPSSRKCSFGSRGAVGGGGKYGTSLALLAALTGGTGTAV